ncbi:MAG: HEAT repeat domain-containing protein [Kofleriaceae bacterium]|nr:HEAT repeat domain-containing protein [Kofleriaceae bacterium]MCB9572492.1 HEAT repeat domain-containing protein [Kofleriaceae bacterium]
MADSPAPRLSRRRPRLAAAVVAAVVVAAVVAAVVVLAGRPPATAADRAAADRGFRWPVGTERVYRLSLRADQRAAMMPDVHDAAPATRVGGDLALDALVAMRAVRTTARGVVVAISFTRVDTADLDLTGADVFASLDDARAQLIGPELEVELAPSGQILGLAAAVDAPPVFDALVQVVTEEIEVVLGAGDAWSTEQATTLGRGGVAYQVTACDHPDQLCADRRRGRFDRLQGLAVDDVVQDVTSRYAVVVDPARGALLRVAGDEHVAIAPAARPDDRLRETSRTLSFELVDEHPATRPAPPPGAATAARRAVAPGEPLVGSGDDARLAQRIDGLTAAELTDLLRKFGDGGTMPDHSRFMWRATALVATDPAARAALAALFARPETGAMGRLLVTDILVSAGSPEAQQVLRRLIDDGAPGDAPPVAALMARTAMIQTPTAETARWLADRYAAAGADDPSKRAMTYALGAIAGRLVDDDGARTPQAQAIARQLRAELDATADPTHARWLLGALGNAGDPAQVDAIVPYLASDDPASVRAALTALRRTPDDDATSRVIALLADPGRGAVHVDALRLLTGYHLDAARFDDVMAAARAAAPDQGYRAALFDLAMARDGEFPDQTVAALRWLAAEPVDDARLRARIDGALAEHGG